MAQNKNVSVKTVMILSENNDYSTSKVMDWIKYYGGKSIRINKDTAICLNSYDLINEKTPSYNVEINGKEYTSNDIFSYWYRRGYFDLITINPTHSNLPKNIRSELDFHLKEEVEILVQAIHQINESKYSIGKISNANVNKLKVLTLAKQIGLIIPNTKIITNSKQLSDLLKTETPYITKAISEGLLMENKEEDRFESYISYTEFIDNIPSEFSFFPSLIQEKLDKSYELRIFYLHGQFYAMAIFSQNDSKTDTDFRKYNKEKPNRNTPFKLPKVISKKLNKLMIQLNLNTGSIDMVVTKKQEYVFLEVNPVGQFGMVSTPCNYKLEKKIAKHLLNI